MAARIARSPFSSTMRNPVFPFLAALAIATATVAMLRHDAAPPPTLPAAPRVATPAQHNLPRVRRLLYTRLNRPADLRIEGLRPSRVHQYSGVACGRVAWNDTDGYKRFIAAKRNVLIDGQSPEFDGTWQRICNGGPTMGAPPQPLSTP